MLNFVVAHSGRFGRLLHTLKNDKRGVSALEYGILAAVIGAGVAVAAPSYVSALTTLFGNLLQGAQGVAIPVF